jgi:hypothetical protein
MSNRIGRRPKYRLTTNAALMSSVPHGPQDSEQRAEFCSEDNAGVGFMISSMPTNLESRKY